MSAVANRYAKALADVVTEGGDPRGARDAIHGFNQLMTGHAELQSVFSNPTIPVAQKQGVLDALIERMQPPQTVKNFLQLLLKNYRLHQLGEIVEAFDREIDRRIGVVTAEITTAGPLDEKEKAELSNRLNQITGKTVRLQFSIDPDIIGGVVTRIGSVIYDGSIKNHLREIEIRLRGINAN